MRNGGAVLAFLLTIAAAHGSALGADKPSQSCDVGPLTRTYGKTDWLLYSCNNQKAEGNAMLVLVSAPGSPAMPFVFFYYIKDGGYRLYGEGTGDKGATRAALDELQQLTESDIADLIVQTRQIQLQGKQSGGKRSP
jgi:hypothetical protein